MTIGDYIMDYKGMTDYAILREIGRRLKRRRLERNLSQQKVADLAGLARSTIVEIEKGSPSTLLTFVQILRALDVLDELDSFLPDPGISPLQLVRLKGKERMRASRRPHTGDEGDLSW